MLLRSGIGPARDLQKLGIVPVVDRPGVGENLQNHCYLHFGLTIPPGLRLDARLHQFGLAGLRFSSGLPDCAAGDLLLFAIGRVSPRPDGAAMGMLGAALYSPYSRGRVTLDSPDIHVPPRIDFRFLSDPRDPPRMLKAARYAEGLLREAAVVETYEDAFLLPPVLSLYQFNKPGLSGALFAAGSKVVLAAPRAVKRRVLERVIHPGRWVANAKRQSVVTDAELLAAAAPMGHVSSTCAIGRPDAPLSVVDPECRVYGVGNLRVVDASVMPSVPTANTNLPTTMVAERAAELIRGGR
jgi:5-(hydroxymethyl)furfural/furfural oxidase